MGYNNNFAGMHFMKHKHYAQYEDLAYYDKLAEEKRKQEIEKEAVLKEEKKAEKAKKNIKEKLISDEQMQISFDIYANIFIIAFDRKIDIYQSIKECELLCERDEIVGQTHAFAMNPLEKSVVFLGLLAEKMNCKITDFFALDLEDRRKIAYRILKDELERREEEPGLLRCFIEIHKIEDEEFENEDVKSVIRISLNEYSYLNVTPSLENHREVNMQYYIDKVIFKNDECLYALYVSTKDQYILSSEFQTFSYMYKGSEVYSEKEGYMAECFEKAYKIYVENGGTILDFLD